MPTHRPLLAELHDGWTARGWSLADLDHLVMMADPPEPDPEPDPPEPDPEPDPPEPEKKDDDPAAEAAKWKALARKHEQRAKENAKAQKELDELKRKSLSDQERAVEEAKEEGRKEASTSVGQKLAAAELRAALTGLVDDPSEIVEDLNLAKFVGDDGEVDTDKVAALKQKYADLKPATGTKRLDLGQGRRSTGDGTPSVASGRDRYEEKHRKKQ